MVTVPLVVGAPIRTAKETADDKKQRIFKKV